MYSDTVQDTNQWLRFQHGLSKTVFFCSTSPTLQHELRPRCLPSHSKPRMIMILLYCICRFKERFSQHEPFRSAPSEFIYKRKKTGFKAGLVLTCTDAQNVQ